MDIFKSDTGPKLVGIGEAVVIGVRKDPKQVAHQVKISHPDFGETTYIPYITPAGMYRAPRIGDICYVFCNENFHQYPLAWGHRVSPQLAAQLIGERADNITVIYSSGKDNNSVSHKIELDDGDQKGVRVTSAAGHTVNLADEGNVTVTHKDGASVALSGDTISLSAGGSTLTIGPDGIKLVAATGSDLEVGTSITGIAADAKSTFDEVGVATHNHIGNLGYPTTMPIKGT